MKNSLFVCLFVGRHCVNLIPGSSVVKNLPAKARETGDEIPGFDPWVGDSNILQYSCLENLMDIRTWQDTVHGVSKSQIQLSIHACILDAVLLNFRLLKPTFLPLTLKKAEFHLLVHSVMCSMVSG